MSKSRVAQPHAKASFATADDGAGALPVRWLANLCGLPSAYCLPRLASALIADKEHVAKAAAHVGWWSRNAGSASNFVRLTGSIPHVPDTEVFAVLHRKGYDGLLYEQDGRIVGHCFFQRHSTELHAFSVWIDEQHRGRTFMAIAFFDFVAHASTCPGIVKARVGAGHPGDRILRPLKLFSEKLGWRVSKGAWVDFCVRNPEHTDT